MALNIIIANLEKERNLRQFICLNVGIMANFFVDYKTCRKVWWEIEQVKGKLGIQRNRVIQTKQILRGVGGYESVNPALDKVMDELEQQKNNLETLKDVLRDCMDCYEETEKTIAETGKTFTTEYAHAVLDLLGMLPVAGMAFDGVSGLWYFAEEDYSNALMSGAAFFPIVGEFAGGGKLVDDIPQLLNDVLINAPIKTGSNSKGLFADYVFNGNTYRVAYGTNGYIVSFYPID